MKVNRKQLIGELSSVSSGLANKEVIEQTTSFVFRDGLVFTFNDEIAVSCPTDLDIDGAVPAKDFLNLLSKLGTEDVDITNAEGEVRIKGSKAKAGIRLESKIKLPIDDIQIPEDDEWTPLPKNFHNAIKACLSSVSKDQTKPVIMCIHFDGVVAESTDNFRATQYTMDSAPFGSHVLIPAASAKEVMNIPIIECGITKGWLHFRTKSDLLFSCRFFNDSFHDISHIIMRKGVDLEFPKNLGDILSKATSISDNRRITISLDTNLITVRAEGSVGWFEESAKMKYKDKAVVFEIHPDYLMDMLKQDVDILFTGKTIEFSTEESIHVVGVMLTTKK